MLAGGWPGADHWASDTADTSGLARLAATQHAWALQAFGLALLLMALARQPVRRVLMLAGVFGLIWQTGGIAWLHIGMHKYAGLPAVWSVAAVLALGLYLAAYTVLAAGAWAAITRHRGLGPWSAAVLFAATWLLADLGRTVIFTGFPWAHGGYAHLHGPMRPLVPWLGVDGISALAAFFAAAAVLTWHAPGRLPRKLLILGAGAGLLGGLAQWPDPQFTRSTGEFDAVLLQSNVSQDGKFEGQRVGQDMAWHARALEKSFADLTLTPETAIPVLEHQLPPAYMARLQQRAQARPGVLLIGLPRALPSHGQVNALIGLGTAGSLPGHGPGQPYRYEKSHLVPFGEFTPAGFAWFTRRLDLPMPVFQRSSLPPDPMPLLTRSGALQRVAALICFEDLFSVELARRFAVPHAAPTVLANASNLAWFDDSPAIAQHLRIAQMRSLEFQRPALRATNTGATALIDHHGEVLRALPPRTRDTLSVVVEGREGLTPYARWASLAGNAPPFIVAMGIVLLCLAPRARALPAAAT
jgi:apolipoprotein N-acyltransferase